MSENEWRAYLVAVLDTSFDPPRVAYVSIYSAPGNALTSHDLRKHCQVDVASAYGASYSEARANLEKHMADYPSLHWAKRWIDEKRPHR